MSAKAAEQEFWEKFMDVRRGEDLHGKEGSCARRRRAVEAAENGQETTGMGY